MKHPTSLMSGELALVVSDCLYFPHICLCLLFVVSDFLVNQKAKLVPVLKKRLHIHSTKLALLDCARARKR
jgi:hypothetical protein